MKHFTPVIHVHDLDQTIKNVEICLDANTFGFFLINHRMNFKKFLPIIVSIREKYPTSWIGVNVLGENPGDVASKLPPIQGIWCDDTFLIEEQETQETAETILSSIRYNQPNCKYFGGVAFKYQNQPIDLSGMVRLATRYVDVITTSGDRTGDPADIQKIDTMFKAASGHPLAIASGVYVNNITSYIPFIDWFLVATHISIDCYNLDPILVKQMSKKI